MALEQQFEEFTNSLKLKLEDPRYIILLSMFAIGFMSILGSIESDLIILGPVTEWLREDILILFGPALRGVIGLMIAVFAWQFLLSLISGEGGLFGLQGWISAVLIVVILLFLISYLPALFGEEVGGVFSVIEGVDNFVNP